MCTFEQPLLTWKYFSIYCIFKIQVFNIDNVNDKKSSNKYFKLFIFLITYSVLLCYILNYCLSQRKEE